MQGSIFCIEIIKELCYATCVIQTLKYVLAFIAMLFANLCKKIAYALSLYTGQQSETKCQWPVIYLILKYQQNTKYYWLALTFNSNRNQNKIIPLKTNFDKWGKCVVRWTFILTLDNKRFGSQRSDPGKSSQVQPSQAKSWPSQSVHCGWTMICQAGATRREEWRS